MWSLTPACGPLCGGHDEALRIRSARRFAVIALGCALQTVILSLHWSSAGADAAAAQGNGTAEPRPPWGWGRAGQGDRISAILVTSLFLPAAPLALLAAALLRVARVQAAATQCCTVVTLVLVALVSGCLVATLEGLDVACKQHLIQVAALIWRHACLAVVAGPRPPHAVAAGASLVALSLCEILGLWLAAGQGKTPPPWPATASSLVLSACYGLVLVSGAAPLAPPGGAERSQGRTAELLERLETERETVLRLLEMACHIVVHVSADGVVEESCEQLEALVHRRMRGSQFSTCLLGPQEKLDLHVAVYRARHGSSSAVVRSRLATGLEVDVAIVAGGDELRGCGIYAEDGEAKGFLLGVRPTSNRVGPAGKRSCRPFAVTDARGWDDDADARDDEAAPPAPESVLSEDVIMGASADSSCFVCRDGQGDGEGNPREEPQKVFSGGSVAPPGPSQSTSKASFFSAPADFCHAASRRSVFSSPRLSGILGGRGAAGSPVATPSSKLVGSPAGEQLDAPAKTPSARNFGELEAFEEERPEERPEQQPPPAVAHLLLSPPAFTWPRGGPDAGSTTTPSTTIGEPVWVPDVRISVETADPGAAASPSPASLRLPTMPSPSPSSLPAMLAPSPATTSASKLRGPSPGAAQRVGAAASEGVASASGRGGDALCASPTSSVGKRPSRSMRGGEDTPKSSVGRRPSRPAFGSEMSSLSSFEDCPVGGGGGLAPAVLKRFHVERHRLVERVHPEAEEIEEQRRLGPQSKRGEASQEQLSILDYHPHAQACFNEFAGNEERLCGEWAVFYHSYSFAALIYELQAAIAAALFGFPASKCTLPRILLADFAGTPDAAALVEQFKSRFKTQMLDHHPDYRAVAISVMCSLVALGPEVSTPTMFLAGFSQYDLSFVHVLHKTLSACHVPRHKIEHMATEIVALAGRYGLDVSRFGGSECESGKNGHLLQIFIRRTVLDRLAYASKPYGPLDSKRHPISSWLASDAKTNHGQARILAHPKWFLSPRYVRMFIASADPTFHERRPAFQLELVRMVNEAYSSPEIRQRAAGDILEGVVPDWWAQQEGRGRRRVRARREGCIMQ